MIFVRWYWKPGYWPDNTDLDLCNSQCCVKVICEGLGSIIYYGTAIPCVLPCLFSVGYAESISLCVLRVNISGNPHCAVTPLRSRPKVSELWLQLRSVEGVLRRRGITCKCSFTTSQAGAAQSVWRDPRTNVYMGASALGLLLVRHSCHSSLSPSIMYIEVTLGKNSCSLIWPSEQCGFNKTLSIFFGFCTILLRI